MADAGGWLDRPPNKIGTGIALALVVLVTRAITGSGSTPAPVAIPEAQPVVETEARIIPSPSPTRTPPPMSAISLAIGDARGTIEALGETGAALYSENCYAELGRAFVTATLDRCAAFDILAAQMLGRAPGSLMPERFGEDAIRSRFLSAALAGGEDEAAAGRRLTEIANAAASNVASVPRAESSAAPDANKADETGTNSAIEETDETTDAPADAAPLPEQLDQLLRSDNDRGTPQ